MAQSSVCAAFIPSPAGQSESPRRIAGSAARRLARIAASKKRPRARPQNSKLPPEKCRHRRIKITDANASSRRPRPCAPCGDICLLLGGLYRPSRERRIGCDRYVQRFLRRPAAKSFIRWADRRHCASRPSAAGTAAAGRHRAAARPPSLIVRGLNKINIQAGGDAGIRTLDTP